jgi:glycosyltransferase involved in cell wall biosynthesis
VQALAEALALERPAAGLRLREWSPEATWQAIGDCDLVVLPQDHRSPWGVVKSHNRLVEAIRGGRVAVASPIPSYRELADYAWVGEDLGEGVAWALANPREAVARVARGQDYIQQRFAPELIGRKWLQVLGVDAEIDASRRAHPALPTEP